MGKLFAVLASLCITVILVFGQAARITADNHSKDDRLLIQRERQWCEAFKDSNEVVLKEIVSEDFVFTDDAGRVSGKHQYIKATNNIHVKSYALKDLTLHVYGETGIVAGTWVGILTVEGKDEEASFRFTDTFVKRAGQWYVVASQDTKLL